MPVVRIPTPLRGLTDGAPTVEVPGRRVGEVLLALAAAHPGVRERLLDDEGGLQRFVNVFVADRDVRDLDGLDTEVGPREVVSIVPAVAGGS